jgi:YD repeat-containing protein
MDAANGVTAFTYDPRDHSTAMTDPRGLTTTYTYDGLDDLIQQMSPDTETTISTYDAAGNRTSRTDARGVTVHYTYNALLS